MTWDYYTATVVLRLACAIFLGTVLIKATGRFLWWQGVFYFALGASMAIFFARNMVSEEAAEFLRIGGVTLQAVALLGVSFMCLFKKFD